jgi:hypothetical protein
MSFEKFFGYQWKKKDFFCTVKKNVRVRPTEMAVAFAC